MPRIVLDELPLPVREFIHSLDVQDEVLELQLAGRTVCEVHPAQSSEVEEPLLQRARRLIERARTRNVEVEEATLEAEIAAAVETVRSRR